MTTDKTTDKAPPDLAKQAAGADGGDAVSDEIKVDTPRVVDQWRRSDGRYFLEAYYYAFEPTGCEPIDRILAAVAYAGKCAHHTESWNERGCAYLGAYLAQCEQFRCITCGSWLSFGESNDTPPEVAIEVRAAELAQRIRDGLPLGAQHLDEEHGWRDYANEDRGGDCSCSLASTVHHLVNNWHAGYLARAIATHEEP